MIALVFQFRTREKTRNPSVLKALNNCPKGIKNVAYIYVWTAYLRGMVNIGLIQDGSMPRLNTPYRPTYLKSNYGFMIKSLDPVKDNLHAHARGFSPWPKKKSAPFQRFKAI